jgi:ABC-type proline/glycine betaine transport system substrate-binding protein
MNERIKDLAHQAWDDQNKFAELIIADCTACCEIVAQAAIDARDRASDSYSHGREDAARLCRVAIERHFGEGK